MTLKQLGIRKLRMNDIVRIGDLQWTKLDSPLSEDIKNMLEVNKNTWCLGYQICTEEMQNYGNAIYRKLPSKS